MIVVRDEALNRLNQKVPVRLHESGVAVPSHRQINGKYALRVAIANHRSRKEDFDILVRGVVGVGRGLLREESGFAP